jgi:fructokinase
MKTTRPALIVFGECLVDWIGGQAVPGGAPFNVARHLAALGLDPLFITRIGADANGRLLLGELERSGVRLDGVQVDARRPTGQVLVHERDGGHAFEILADQAYDHIADAADEIVNGVPAAGAAGVWLYFGTLAQRSGRSRDSLAALQSRVAHSAFVDLNWRENQVAPKLARTTLFHADELKVSADELALLLRWSGLASRYSAIVPGTGTQCPGIGALLRDTRVAHLIVTHGRGGYALWDGSGQCRASGPGTVVTHPVDTVGAGDAFAAIVLAGHVLGWPRNMALARANQFAAAICTVRGSVPADPDYYDHWKMRWTPDPVSQI